MVADLEACRVFDGSFSLQLLQTRIRMLIRVWNLTDQTAFLQLKQTLNHLFIFSEDLSVSASLLTGA